MMYYWNKCVLGVVMNECRTTGATSWERPSIRPRPLPPRPPVLSARNVAPRPAEPATRKTKAKCPLGSWKEYAEASKKRRRLVKVRSSIYCPLPITFFRPK